MRRKNNFFRFVVFAYRFELLNNFWRKIWLILYKHAAMFEIVYLISLGNGLFVYAPVCLRSKMIPGRGRYGIVPAYINRIDMLLSLAGNTLAENLCGLIVYSFCNKHDASRDTGKHNCQRPVTRQFFLFLCRCPFPLTLFAFHAFALVAGLLRLRLFHKKGLATPPTGHISAPSCRRITPQ